MQCAIPILTLTFALPNPHPTLHATTELHPLRLSSQPTPAPLSHSCPPIAPIASRLGRAVADPPLRRPYLVTGEAQQQWRDEQKLSRFEYELAPGRDGYWRLKDQPEYV